MSQDEKAVQLRISGRVQGVCFRMETQAYARKLGLTGWVRNCSDGSVEALAEGPSAALKQFVAWCQRGPGMARVDSVAEDWGLASGGFTQFEITH